MANNESLTYIQTDMAISVNILKTILFIFFIYCTNHKISTGKIKPDKRWIRDIILIALISLVHVTIKVGVNFFVGIISLIMMIALIFATDNIGHSFITTSISIGINYAISIIAIILSFIPNGILKINNDIINLIVINILHATTLIAIFRTKKFKYGFSFLSKKQNNENIDILILNISAIMIVSVIILREANLEVARNLSVLLVVFSIIMFRNIKQSLKLFYKQKLLEQELIKVKDELAKKTKEVEDLEAENISISKKSHTLVHKQKSLEYKIEEMINKTEISKEESAEVRERLKEIEKDLYTEKKVIELDKTGINLIDDMLKYMQKQCSENKIDFELQLNGNIHHMTNNLISKEELETLLADHIKNAIIAINHTDNINRSILVKLGKIDNEYGLYIYDSGIQFEKETLENLGKKPSTTHKDEGGTGMGFMNTFDILKKSNASLIIEEYDKPNKDNYTKVIMIKFDNKNEFETKSRI